jgi:DNA-binding FadR family transcriptional regulator
MTDEADLDVGLTTGALRAMLATPGSSEGRAVDLARRLADAIQVGLILDGERLPSEARLAAQLGVASVTLREVLRILRSQGLIATRRGHGGGTVVTAPPDKSAWLSERLQRLTLLDIRDLGDQRRALFCAAAELAAERALPADVARLRSHVARLSMGTDAGELRRADSLFTVEVAVAAQSPRLAREDLRVRAEVGDLLWLHPADQDLERAVTLRTQLVFAIAAGDVAGAGASARRVIEHDTRRLADRRLAAYRQGPTGSPDPLAPPSDLDDRVGRVFASLRELAEQFSRLAGEGSREQGLRRRDLAALRPEIAVVLDGHQDLLVGAGIVVRPGLLTDVDRWLEWLWRADGGRPEVLRINLDPSAPDFYDYAAAEWFQHPRTTRRPEITGPYVDAPCTGEYALTVSVPVYLDDEFVGVVAADIPVGVVEAIVARELGELSPPTILVTRDRRVLVSTDERHLPGDLYQPGRGEQAGPQVAVRVFESAPVDPAG